jgi:DNA-binding NarL/FixJ family response regulator
MGAQMSNKTRVLIADDEPLVVEVIEGLLEDLGYVVVGKATNGFDAIEMTQSLQPDVVLMDIRMPGVDGVEATRRIQELRPTPVVMVTGDDKPEVVERASKAGAGAYVLKEPSGLEIDRAITIARARFKDMVELRQLTADLQRRNEEREMLIAELRDVLSKVKTLRGLLPICASCKKIRDDQGYWQQIEQYLRDHSGAEFTHGLCPECAEKLRRELRGGGH